MRTTTILVSDIQSTTVQTHSQTADMAFTIIHAHAQSLNHSLALFRVIHNNSQSYTVIISMYLNCRL